MCTQQLIIREPIQSFVTCLPLREETIREPTAIEMAIMALSDCAANIFAKVAKQSNINIKRIEVITEATKTEESPIIRDVIMRVNVEAEARNQLLEALWRRTEASCPVVKIFTEPIPIKIELSWH